MSATVTPPPGAPDLARSDWRLRLADYEAALTFYLGLPDRCVDRILFIDNSASDLSALERLVESRGGGKRVELVSFSGNDHPLEYGRGYGEFKLLDHGLSRSSLLSRESVFWKVTGRLRVLNLVELVETAPPDYTLYCDLRDVPWIGNRFGGNRWMDLRLFSCTVEGYDRLIRNQYPNLKASLCGSPEFFFFDHVRRALSDEAVVPRFRVQPQIAGVGGHRNADYQKASYRMKSAARALARKVAPWLWL